MARPSFKKMILIAAGTLSTSGLAGPSHSQDRAVPDFSGLWARMTFAAEPPVSGPGPIDNLIRRPDGVRDGSKLVGDYMNPLLKPAAAEHVRQLGEVSKTGNAFPDPSNQCAPQSPPYILRQQEIQLLQEKDQITILYMLDHHMRRVRLNSTHPADVTPSWGGDSIGRYEGDTLVVDTVGIRVGPASMADQYGSPQSDAMHVTERYRLVANATAKAAFAQNEKEFGRAAGENSNGVYIDFDYTGNGLQMQYTVDDPGVFTTAWGATVTYTRAGSPWVEQICAENTREYYDNKDTLVPVSARADF